jgi:translation initiation factor IF-3
LISSATDPPVCKIIDYGQHMYEQQKKDKLNKKGAKGQVLKELKMSPKISIHDYMVRVNSAKKFLAKGYKIKLSIFFKGREITHVELGYVLIDRYLKDLIDCGVPVAGVSRTGKMLTCMINPK